jgi:hypothetical protein
VDTRKGAQLGQDGPSGERTRQGEVQEVHRQKREQRTAKTQDAVRGRTMAQLALQHTAWTWTQAPMPSAFPSHSRQRRGSVQPRTSKPAILKRRLGLSLEYTDTKLLSHSNVVRERGKRFFMSQNTCDKEKDRQAGSDSLKVQSVGVLYTASKKVHWVHLVHCSRPVPRTARPRLTSCFIRRMRASRGQHLRLL